MAVDKLEGTTLNVYLCIARAGEPVGVRDVTRSVALSSTSVAYHHLQKLEDLGLIEKNSYSQYILKGKASVEGYLLIGKNFVPRLMLYASFFVGLFVAEIIVILFSMGVENLVIETNFLLLTVLTFVAMLLFIKEGLWLHRKLNSKRADRK
ncbi:MAG: hypothetical protein FWC33_00105 [Candidatus Bathyarchaeota archaeon]|nr:hypothetical protein [Candidatus Termiticorpusculum sp.]